jgi:hypothetical protein
MSVRSLTDEQVKQLRAEGILDSEGAYNLPTASYFEALTVSNKLWEYKESELDSCYLKNGRLECKFEYGAVTVVKSSRKELYNYAVTVHKRLWSIYNKLRNKELLDMIDKNLG